MSWIQAGAGEGRPQQPREDGRGRPRGLSPNLWAAGDGGRGPGLKAPAGPEDFSPRGPHITPFVLSPRISQRVPSL